MSDMSFAAEPAEGEIVHQIVCFCSPFVPRLNDL